MTSTARQLPPDWQWMELGNLFEEERNQVQAGDPDFAGLPFVGLENIESHTRRFISESPAKAESTCFRFDHTHVLYGKLRPYLDKVFLPDIPGKCCMEILTLRPAAGVSRAFLAAALQSKQVIDCAVKYSTGGRMPRADIRKLKRLCVPVPREEAARDSLAAELERKLSKVESMRRASERQIDAAATLECAFLRNALHTGRGDRLPSGWMRVPLGKMADINPRRKALGAEKADAMVSFVPMDAIDETLGQIATRITKPLSSVAKGYTYFEEGDVLFAKITPCMQNGKSAIATGLTKGFGFGTTEFHVLRAKPGIRREWLLFLVRTREFRDAAEAKFDGSAGQQRVPADFMRDYPVPIPPTIDDQENIVKDVERQRKAISRIRAASANERDAVSALPGAILREAFDFG